MDPRPRRAWVTVPVAALSFALLAAAVAGAQQRPVPPGFLRALRDGHPRLIVDAARLDELRALHERDATLQRYFADVLAGADAALQRPPLEHRLRGPRLLQVSRDALDRVRHLAFAWRFGREPRYRDGALACLRQVCAFDDWNPSHFLDVAEMSHAVGLGYDWLYPDLDEDQRFELRRALVRLGLRPGVAQIEADAWWTRTQFNWNPVCFGGLLVGALAVADVEPEWAERIVPRAVERLPRALAMYDPDGAWAEGPAYWGYATRYVMHGLAALQTALGTDFGLGHGSGLRAAGHFPIHGTGPTGAYFNFADASTNARRGPLGELLWLSRRFDDPALAVAEHAFLGQARATPTHVFHYVPLPAEAAATELDRLFEGPVPVASLRSAWGDPDAAWLAAKGGRNDVNHGQLDASSFVFEARGVRWASDLGSDDYELPGYFDGKPGGRRWSWFRNRSEAHNVLLALGDDGTPIEQPVAADVHVERFAIREKCAFVVFDTTSAFAARVAEARRGLGLFDDRQRAIVQDELRLTAPSALRWAMTTAAAIEIDADGRRAVLRLADRELSCELLAPDDARFSTRAVERRQPEATNTGYRQLLAEIPAGRRSVRVTVALTPAGTTAPPPRVTPLGTW